MSLESNNNSDRSNSNTRQVKRNQKEAIKLLDGAAAPGTVRVDAPRAAPPLSMERLMQLYGVQHFRQLVSYDKFYSVPMGDERSRGMCLRGLAGVLSEPPRRPAVYVCSRLACVCSLSLFR